MHTEKFSISLPQQQYEFVEAYQSTHHYKSRSEVIKKALYLLQQAELETLYLEANDEIEEAFDVTAADGLDEHETWWNLLCQSWPYGGFWD